MNTELRKNVKANFEKYIFRLMNNAVFGKTMENARYHRGIKLTTIEARRNYLKCKLSYNKKNFSDNLLAMEFKETQIHLNKLVYLGLSILEISKKVTYEFCYDYVKPKYGENLKLCYTNRMTTFT